MLRKILCGCALALTASSAIAAGSSDPYDIHIWNGEKHPREVCYYTYTAGKGSNKANVSIPLFVTGKHPERTAHATSTFGYKFPTNGWINGDHSCGITRPDNGKDITSGRAAIGD